MNMGTDTIKRITYRFTTATYTLVLGVILLSACSTQRQVGKFARTALFNDSVLRHAHVGIAVFDPGSGQYLYQHNADRYFVPASNIKIVSAYTAMKYLGDSLPALRYAKTEQGIFLQGTGDPSFLHSDFQTHPAFRFLKQQEQPLFLDVSNWKAEALGDGWSWNDYSYSYMVERSPLPVYGNVIHWYQEKQEPEKYDSSQPDVSISIYSIPEVNWKVRFNPDDKARRFAVVRSKDANIFTITEGKENKAEAEVPFVTEVANSALELLRDTLGKEIRLIEGPLPNTLRYELIRSQPVDALLKPMMARSDNFYAEQVLMMVSQQLLGEINEEKLIDTLLRTTLKDLPQAPRWADGSGLSRYNLFSPLDFIHLLGKINTEFGMDRVKKVFATGGAGTLGTVYRQDSGYIYAKTGTLSGVVCLSGYLYTRKAKWLQFSILINNHRGSASAIRRKTEQFLRELREKY